MRLDQFLVSKGFFTTRQKAKEAIKRGFVFVNGVRVTKPSARVSGDAEIEVRCEERPRGYWKLAEIDARWKIIDKNDIVLDLGSSAGGFLLYASERAKKVYGIEFSREFEEELRKIESDRKNVRVFIGDAFTFDTSMLEPLDVILDDLTLEPSASLKALSRFLPLLKDGGRVLFVMKEGKNPEFEEYGLEVVDVIDSSERREKYFLLIKSCKVPPSASP
ncbi:S4 domain-containing protein [Archaeoglobus veneficus]|uniref:RNA-binding S4 domain protein n=1 Tax=Archaeoglobus veneficus (strain DSM 11195 / SNP6) TaxID=693661 RepID=F2KNT5_ARCVS|nr:S4 domain-containing protein [Archaeoglobus veneficus]AEA47412.1 RNA-binding S4 domain protein [Archaeoglobus veneficus SNP6]